MGTKKQWQKEVRQTFKKIKSHTKPYDTKTNGFNITIFPNVFSPAYFTDSQWFAQKISEIVGQHSLLEIGTGSGLTALVAYKNGAKVNATDINPDAVKNAEYNFKKYSANIPVYCGDMYKAISPEKKFDFIFWNHPFNEGDNPDEEILLKSGFDYKYKSLEKYISEAKNYLTNNGRVLLGTGNFAKLNKIEKIAKKHGYKIKLLEKIEIPLTDKSEIANDYRIYEFIK